jgi:hypothetical protein
MVDGQKIVCACAETAAKLTIDPRKTDFQLGATTRGETACIPQSPIYMSSRRLDGIIKAA